ncbi:DNase I-like protein [Eremomyces bilateralis CBS 781.70]|uniref:DNase I-like protein n=1 Tax=Eremomyces bilateralis CBS 781.70 TaxID=1392243 RepID=A0A6G1FU81_9PEZI|nr:DNase I-like protein [Eremomyces bilateralis CBS 781.70]KAF1809266.1 DNase I-like protein [Eremomyces bilateralis CBS 781.70]
MSSADQPPGADDVSSSLPGAFPGNGQDSAATPNQQSLAEGVYARRHEFVRPRSLRIRVGSWNVAALKGTEQDLGDWFIDGKGVTESLGGLSATTSREEHGSHSENGPEVENVVNQELRRTQKESTVPRNDDGVPPRGDEVGLYVLGLQEVVDVASPTENIRPYTDPGPANKFKSAIEAGLPAGYELVAEQQLIGLLLLIYAAPDVAPELKSISTTSVGTGLMGYMGNKGAVTARLVLGETTRLVFINCHLAAGADGAALERRNWDFGQVMSRTRFDPIDDVFGFQHTNAESIGDEDFAFCFGDFNYRLDGTPGEDVRRLLMLHTRNEYDLGKYDASKNEEDIRNLGSGDRPKSRARLSSKLSTVGIAGEPRSDEKQDSALEIPHDLDPSSLQATLASLLPHDELQLQMKARKAFHDGWKEGPIRFLPTYKYDVGTVGDFDSSEKRRCPSWCDRVVYRTRKSKLDYDSQIKEEQESKKRDEEMKSRGVDDTSADEGVLWDYDPDADGDAGSYDEDAGLAMERVMTREGFEDTITLEAYGSHQRVLSSDHKPLEAIFLIKYDSVIPELKAKVHQEVARELDRAENEGRPTVTVLTDPSSGDNEDEELSDTNPQNADSINFGKVRYGQLRRRQLTVANTGQVPARISFVDRAVAEGQSRGSTPPWLVIGFDRDPEPNPPASAVRNGLGLKTYLLEPGEATTVVLILRVDNTDLVKALNNHTATLDDVLILRVENGRDHFLPIHGHWLRSSLGSTVDKLIRIPEGGVRKLQRQKPHGSGSSKSSRSSGASASGGSGSAPATDPPGVKWSTPRELFRLTEALEHMIQRSLAEFDMIAGTDDVAPWIENAAWPFHEDSWTFQDEEKRKEILWKIQDAVDCDHGFEKAFSLEDTSIRKAECLADALLTFLRSMDDGLVTTSRWEALELTMISHEKAKKHRSLEEDRASFLERLAEAPIHNASFFLLTTMLSRIISEVVSASKSRHRALPHPIELPASPRVSRRRKTLSADPVEARKQLMELNYATIFAEAVVRPSTMASNAKHKSSHERKARFIETFLRG